MRAVALALLGLAAYALFLVAQMPASFAVARWHRDDAVALTDVEGTIWHGAARANLKLPLGTLPLDRLEWRLRPSALLSGQAAFDVQARAPGLQAKATMARTFSGNEARDVEASAEAALAARLVPLAGTLRPQGALRVGAPRLAWDANGLRGEATATWSGAQVSFPEPRALGSYRAVFTGTGGPMQVVLSTDEGALRLAGRGTLDAAGRLDFTGEARAGPGAAAESLAPILDLIGPRRPDSSRELRLRVP